jgi:fermentation-respiration switch protein FrsA (DUF1100 family)
MKRLALLLVIFLSGCTSPLTTFERSIIYQGRPDPTPATQEDIFFNSDDGTKLHGRYFETPNPRGIILYCHGNAGSVASWSEAASELQTKHQCSVFLFDYRGYGKSGGLPTESGVLRDARAARRWLAERAGVQENDIVLLGRSLGGGVAVDLAASDGARGLILQSTFPSLPEVAACHVPWMLPRWLMSERFDSINKIKHYQGPLLQSHGDRDTLIPIELAKQLYEAAPGKKTFVKIPHGSHNTPPDEAYHQVLQYFLNVLAPGESPGLVRAK